MKYLMSVLLVLLTMTIGCNGGGEAAGGASGSARSASISATPTTYTFEFSGNGVTFSTDIHAYPVAGWGGFAVETDIVTYLLGASTYSQTVTGESVIANVTLNTGAGVLTIVTKKNGVIVRTDTINTNATGISISN